MTETATAFVGMGSNLSDPEQQLRSAARALERLPGCLKASFSPIYRSRPLGPRQPDYLNAVARLRVALGPEALLDELQAIERDQLRQRAERWGPRTIDLDILLFGQQTYTSPRLSIPHKEMKNRHFVLAPLSDLAPDLRLPDGESLSTALGRLRDDGLQKLEIPF